MFFRENQIESQIFQSRIDAFTFLKLFNPNRLSLLQRIFSKIDFHKFLGKFYVDLTMPSNIGGYFSPAENVIAINPMLLLFGSESSIAHVMYHEGLHAGAYSDGLQIMEEVLVETMTKKKMSELYNSTFKSGYDDMVETASEWFGDMSFDQVMLQIENGDEETFNNILSLATTDSAIKNGNIEDLSWNKIQKKLQKTWPTLQSLFPRMMNKIQKNNRGLHEGTNLSLSAFKLDGLLEKTAKQIIGYNHNLLYDLFKKFEKLEKRDIEEDDLINLFMENGLLYLLDFDADSVRNIFLMYKSESSIDKFLDTFDYKSLSLSLMT